MRSSTRSFLACVAVFTIIGVKAPPALAQPEGTSPPQTKKQRIMKYAKRGIVAGAVAGLAVYTAKYGVSNLIVEAGNHVEHGRQGMAIGQMVAAVGLPVWASLRATEWASRKYARKGIQKLEGTRFGGPTVRGFRKLGHNTKSFMVRKYSAMKTRRMARRMAPR